MSPRSAKSVPTFRNCRNCAAWWEGVALFGHMNAGTCRRFPKTEEKWETDGCYESIPKESH